MQNGEMVSLLRHYHSIESEFRAMLVVQVQFRHLLQLPLFPNMLVLVGYRF